jgi:hypothetical protein
MRDFGAYLERVGLGESDSATWHEIHRAHATSIPFENIDPHRGIPVSLAQEDLERKLVHDGSGAAAHLDQAGEVVACRDAIVPRRRWARRLPSHQCVQDGRGISFPDDLVARPIAVGDADQCALRAGDLSDERVIVGGERLDELEAECVDRRRRARIACHAGKLGLEAP